MMTAFQRAQEHNVDLSPELEDLLSRALGQITRTYRYAKAPREIFKAILSKKGEVGRALRLMHRTDFLGRYVPEFGQLTCLVQHEFFHRYTADEHTLLCIDKLDALMRTNDPKLIPYRLFSKIWKNRSCFISLCFCTTRDEQWVRARIPKPALFSRKVWPSASSFRRSKENR